MICLRYSVEYYDKFEAGYEKDKGIVSGADYNDIMNTIFENYSRDSIVSMAFYECNTLMNDEELQEILDEDGLETYCINLN